MKLTIKNEKDSNIRTGDFLIVQDNGEEPRVRQIILHQRTTSSCRWKQMDVHPNNQP